MASRHPRIQVPADPELAAAIERGRAALGGARPASQVIRALALRGAESLEVDTAARDRAVDFLVGIADGTSGFDLEQLRSVRERAWR